MAQTDPHHLVQFAVRHALARLKTFDAYSALWRAENLVDDAERLRELKKHVEGTQFDFGSYRSTYEIFSYFAVGLVTCLEWHARSRLVDLLTFKPSCIEKKDFDQIKNDALSQMMAYNVTVAHLIGANKSISNIRDYVSVFDRLFDALEVAVNIERELRDIKVDETPEINLYADLDRLFKDRNHLVHEIDISLVGPYTIRDPMSLDEAVIKGKGVIDAIKLIEGHITKHSPESFPNRLTKDGHPEDELEKLKQAVSLLEEDISKKLKAFENDAGWSEALKASRLSQSKEMEFLEDADFLRPIRPLDVRDFVKADYLKGRLAYLSVIRKELEGWDELLTEPI